MSHLTDDELVLHFYDEDDADIVRVERHLETCVDCARRYEGLARTLRAVTPPAIVEAPDEKTMAKVSVELGSRGTMSSQTLAAISAEDFASAL